MVRNNFVCLVGCLSISKENSWFMTQLAYAVPSSLAMFSLAFGLLVGLG